MTSSGNLLATNLKIFSYMNDQTQKSRGRKPPALSSQNQEGSDVAFDKFSLNEIVLRHQAQKKTRAGMKLPRSVGRLMVTRPNKYAALETDEGDGEWTDQSKRLVEVKVFEVLHNQKVSNLVYMQDVSKIIRDLNRDHNLDSNGFSMIEPGRQSAYAPLDVIKNKEAFLLDLKNALKKEFN